MKLATLAERAVLLVDDLAVDVAEAGDGRFGPDTMAVFADWDAFTSWVGSAVPANGRSYDATDLRPVVPLPSQVFGIGLNYSDHATESNPEPADLLVFTKFSSCLVGPTAGVRLISETVDYETELVVVIGREGYAIDEDSAWDHVAGLCVGQDISDRGVQWGGPAPQFSMGRPSPGFGRIGPAVVTLDEIVDPANLSVRATIDFADGTSQIVQDGTTADLILSVPVVVSRLSKIVTLRPGDIIFTGTPAGVGAARGRYLDDGDVLTSEIDRLGVLRNAFRR